ncbi:MAG TPA: ankyrin repeat domain-containing protein [Verrucomicrobiae bacterium]|nr:ankyrin repeat domain-containing protein [Verrucomicrobiae bacterium]
MYEQVSGGVPPLPAEPAPKKRWVRKLIVRLTIVVLALAAFVIYSGRYCLLCAVEDGNDLMVRYYLWRGEDVNQLMKGGFTPLMQAAWKGRVNAAEILLNHGANLEAVDQDGNTALIWAAGYGRYPVVQLLASKGASLNHQNHAGETALIYSMKCRQTEMARLLVKKGADVNLKDDRGETVLVLAGQWGYSDMVWFLKRHGATETRPFIVPSRLPAKPLPPSRLWALATTALLVQYNGDNHELLGSRPPADHAWAQTGLREWWDINSRRSAIEMLDWLQRQGHRGEYQNRERRARRNGGAPIPYLAWDYCRLIWVAGVSYIAGYITEDEAWDRIMPAARALQANYSSWREMGKDYLAGRERWNGGRDPQFAGVFELLTNRRDPNSPWNKNPWNTDLSEAATNSLVFPR